jgi:hypothetical protein
LNFLDLFWKNYLLLKKKLKIENWTGWIVLTNWFLCFNFAKCVLKKINFYIWTFLQFFFQPFFSFFFCFNLWNFFFLKKLIVFHVSTFVESFLEIFFTRASSFNTPKGVCVWLEVFGILDFMLLTSYFGTKFGPIMYNFKPVLKNLMRKRSHTPFPHHGAE